MEDEARASTGSTRTSSTALGGAVLDGEPFNDLLQRLAQLAAHAIDGADSASITVVEDGRFRTTNSTGPTALAIDEAQYRDDTGPCLEAIRSKRQLGVSVSDLEGEAPGFVDEARRANIGSVLSTPLMRDGGEALGAINVYVDEGGAIEADHASAAQLISEHAAILVGYAFALLSSSKLNEQLRHAVATREIIGEAKGILMSSQSCTRDQAFDILRRASQRENRKLRDLAEELVLRIEARAGSQGART